MRKNSKIQTFFIAFLAMTNSTFAQNTSWAWSAGKIQNNGSLSIKSNNGSTAYSLSSNPSGSQANISQSSVTQPPTLIMQKGSGGSGGSCKNKVVGQWAEAPNIKSAGCYGDGDSGVLTEIWVTANDLGFLAYAKSPNDYKLINANFQYDGRKNVEVMAVIDPTLVTFPAAKACKDLRLNGYSDWYLPSINEMIFIYINANVIGGGYMSNRNSGYGYNSSTEQMDSLSIHVTGDYYPSYNTFKYNMSKGSGMPYRCIRRP